MEFLPHEKRCWQDRHFLSLSVFLLISEVVVAMVLGFLVISYQSSPKQMISSSVQEPVVRDLNSQLSYLDRIQGGESIEPVASELSRSQLHLTAGY